MKVYAKYLQPSAQSKYYSKVSTRKFNGIFEKEYIDCVFKIFFILICLLFIMQILYMNCEGFYFYSNSFLGISTGKNPCFIFGELYFLSFQDITRIEILIQVIRLIKVCLLNIYINFNFNVFFFLTLFFFFTFFISVLYKNFLYKLFSNKNVFYYNNKKSYNFYFIFNFVLFLVFFIFYKIYLFNNNFSNSIFIFCKKLKILNVNLLYTFNLDFINFYFIFLTIFIFFIVYFTFFNLKFKNDIDFKNMKIISFLFLLIEVLLILTFSTSNFLFFFIFFELSLMPLYFLILMLGKGGKKKHFAAFALVFYTLFGSIFLLFGIIYLNIISNTLNFKHLSFEVIDFNSQLFLFFLFFVGFSVKVPIFPFYS